VNDELFTAMHHQKIQWQIKARRLERQIGAVRALHHIDPQPEGDPDVEWCHHCGFAWPCETIRIVGEKE